MRLITITTSCARALSAACQLVITLALLLLAAGPVAASPAPPTPISLAPWSVRCYTDTCVGFQVTFDGGHTVALGHSGDNPDYWAIFDGDDLTAAEATFAAATVSALARRDLPGLAVAYPAIPQWYTDSLAAYVVPDQPVYQRWLPLVMR